MYKLITGFYDVGTVLPIRGKWSDETKSVDNLMFTNNK